MNMFLILAFLFFIGSVSGWVLELLYRNLTSHHEKWINPGFCTGPYVPLYGFGLCILYLLASLERMELIANPLWNKILVLLAMAASMTLIEYIAGICCLKIWKVRLWDYSNLWGNIQGIICPIFSLAWAAIGAFYDFLIHPYILGALQWLSQNLAFSFIIGMFFGVFLIDVCHSAHLVGKMKKFAEENQVVVKYENIKHHILEIHQQRSTKSSFFFPFRSEHPLTDTLKEMKENLERRRNNQKS